MNIVNLTRNQLRLRLNAANTEATPDSTDLVVDPSGNEAWVATQAGANVGDVNGVALYGATTFGEVNGLPKPQEDTIYVVSSLVAGQVKGRQDIVSLGTGPKDGPIRNENGHIYAVTRLIRAC